MFLISQEKNLNDNIGIKRNLFSNKIFYSGDKEQYSFKDLIESIKIYTGKPVLINDIINMDSDGVYIIEQPIGNKDGQQFDIQIQGINKAIIWYNKYTGQNNSLSNGIYYLLNKLGFEWLTSNKNGRHIPNLVNIVNEEKHTVIPFLRDRMEFGTGGLDTQIPNGNIVNNINGKTFKERWLNFIRRNRWSSDFTTAGHAGNSFYLNNKELFDANSNEFGYNSPNSWFNSESGKINGRFKIEIPEIVEIIKQSLYFDPTLVPDQFWVIGVDPEDGRGNSDDPLPPDGFEGINNWNHADKWMWFANEVAKMWDENYEHLKISVQSYGDGPTNALAPKFKMRKNVLVNLNPWAFQTAYSPRENMLKAWEDKITGDASVYDYLNITQWSLGMPQHNIQNLVYKLNLYKENKISGVSYETTDSNMMAHIFYILGKIQFDNSLNWEDVYLDWLKKMFGNAWIDMKKIFDRWNNNYQGAADPSFSLIDISNAINKVNKNGLYWRRIMDYAAYIHYQILYYTSASVTNVIYPYMYRINHLMMIQTPAFMGQGYWVDAKPSGNNMTFLTYEEIEANLIQDILDQPKLYDITPFTFDYSKTDYIYGTRGGWSYALIAPFGYVKPRGTTLKFRVSTGSTSNNSTTNIVVNIEDGEILNEIISKNNYSYKENGIMWKEYTLNVIPGKTYSFTKAYRLEILSQEILWNNNSNEQFDNYGFPEKYFYVPKNCKNIAIRAMENLAPYLTIYDTGESKILTEVKSGLYILNVEEEDKGKLWVVNMRQYYGFFLNLPNIVGLNQPFKYNE